MKRALIFLLLSGLIFSANGQTDNKAKRADDFMSAIFNQGQFSGAVLLADHGRIIYNKRLEKMYGIAKCMENRAMVMAGL
ncbi:hypothetical protein [Chitinophaga sp. CF418]|uniref:hypothetical protein n=1 Tax=Chitinophaga sp. CF418 TaxID=1855287 RepID=UPI000919C189|nr:hypothetical protein [Chitinophaga sp. CF418]SHN38631.1 hypothetical protein SAMN05216311_11126 [Chitinophaga sp. CF418]